MNGGYTKFQKYKKWFSQSAYYTIFYPILNNFTMSHTVGMGVKFGTLSYDQQFRSSKQYGNFRTPFINKLDIFAALRAHEK